MVGKEKTAFIVIMKQIIFLGTIIVCLLVGGCITSQDFDYKLNSIVRPYHFGITRWELGAIPHELNKWLFGRSEKIDDEISVVIEFFTATERTKTLRSKIAIAYANNEKNDLSVLEGELKTLQERRRVLQDSVEKIVERQIREALNEQGIFNPLLDIRVNFPPLNFALEKPPYVLVVSPRDRIESIREITLQPSIVLEEIQDIEARVDELGVSALIVAIGGLGATYPTFVTNEASLQYTIEAATEEWLHQYLVLKPLGFLYLLDATGLSRNYEIATMNETVAGIVSKEISNIVYEKYYSEYDNGASQNQTEESESDFDREMREIRKTVDAYLAKGEIEQAEEFMEERRQYLESIGYHIRKLNQAYFAFHGTYADEPAFISPIGLELQELRSQSSSLKDFLNTVAAMTSRQDLIDSIR